MGAGAPGPLRQFRFIDLVPRNRSMPSTPYSRRASLKYRNLWLRHLTRVAQLMEPNGIANPVPVGLLGSWAVMAHADGFAKLIAKSRAPVTLRVHGYSLGAVHMISVMAIGK